MGCIRPILTATMNIAAIETQLTVNARRKSWVSKKATIVPKMAVTKRDRTSPRKWNMTKKKIQENRPVIIGQKINFLIHPPPFFF